MADSFGKILRRRRLDSDVGLRELARLIGKSPGYISDVEQGNVPPPSEQVILKMAAVLDINREILLKAARKMDPELTSYVADEPRAADFLRKAKDRGFEPEDWEKLSKLADIVKPDTSAGGDE
jgi:transcriptional regulator with XRE-family HTH domain